MANLLEALQPQMQDTTSQLSTLLRAKSGKAVGGPSLATSTQQEQAALAQTAQAMQPIEAAAQTQAMGQEQQAREVQQRTQIQQADIAQAREANKLQTQLRTDQILRNLEEGRGEADLKAYQASLEQVGQNLRLSNREYIDNLQREGARARLNDRLQFEEQLNKSIFADNKQLLEKQLGNRSILAANDREWQIRMEQMGTQVAYDIFRNEMKADRERGISTGIGGLITTGLGAYGKYEEAEAADLRRSQNLATSERQSSTSDLAKMKSIKGE